MLGPARLIFFQLVAGVRAHPVEFVWLVRRSVIGVGCDEAEVRKWSKVYLEKVDVDCSCVSNFSNFKSYVLEKFKNLEGFLSWGQELGSQLGFFVDD